jgi:hypothetical protein
MGGWRGCVVSLVWQASTVDIRRLTLNRRHLDLGYFVEYIWGQQHEFMCSVSDRRISLRFAEKQPLTIICSHST